jgi:hypothetical protein
MLRDGVWLKITELSETDEIRTRQNQSMTLSGVALFYCAMILSMSADLRRLVGINTPLCCS